MTRDERRTIGFDRPVHLAWLDAMAGCLAAGASAREARRELWTLLDGVVAGGTPQSARGKTLTVLSRVWLTVPQGVGPMRDAALLLIGQATAEERLAIHWALMSAAYPFFVDLASNVGKLIALNGDLSLSQLTRRLVEVWGDRSTLRPAAQRVVRSMIGWGVLQEGPRPGQYLPAPRRIVVSAPAAELLIEGLLVAAGRGLALGQLLTHPAAFPFELRLDPTGLRKSDRLRLHRQGDQTDFVERKEMRPSSPAVTGVPDRQPEPRRKTKPKTPETAGGEKSAKVTRQLSLLR